MIQEQHRRALDQIPQEREDARHATLEAARATADALSTNLEQLRRIYRDLKDNPKKPPDPGSNWRRLPSRLIGPPFRSWSMKGWRL